jgi:hypothetical protein
MDSKTLTRSRVNPLGKAACLVVISLVSLGLWFAISEAVISIALAVRATVPAGWTASGENKLRLVAG